MTDIGLVEQTEVDPLDPYSWFAHMRAHHPVYQDPETASWYVFRYDDVLRVLNPPIRPTVENPIVFSSYVPMGQTRTLTQDSIIMIDPPRQRAVRGLLNPTFAPNSLRQRYSGRITSLVDGLLDPLGSGDEVDVVATIAYTLPIMVISDLLGIPEWDATQFRDWTLRGVQVDFRGDDTDIETTMPDLTRYLVDLMADRRASPSTEDGDVLTALVHGCPADGVALSAEELLGNSELLLLAGFETTAHLLTNLFRVLGDRPDVQRQVWQDPTLIPDLVEETLRYLSPVNLQFRRTTTDVEVGGELIPADSLVLPLLTSANRDERVFDNADRFDLTRYASGAPDHVAFGFRGTHFCLGAPLARLEATLFLQRLVARTSRIEMVAGAVREPLPLTFTKVPLVNGLRRLPVIWNCR